MERETLETLNITFIIKFTNIFKDQLRNQNFGKN